MQDVKTKLPLHCNLYIQNNNKVRFYYKHDLVSTNYFLPQVPTSTRKPIPT